MHVFDIAFTITLLVYLNIVMTVFITLLNDHLMHFMMYHANAVRMQMRLYV